MPSLLEDTIGMQTFPTLEAMYDASEARKWSGECDFGVWWRSAAARSGELWRVSWIEATGEVYMVKMRWPISDPRPSADIPPSVFVLGSVPTRAAIEERLEGWAERCGADDSLEWIVGRFVA